MRNLLLVLLIIVATIVWWNRSKHRPLREAPAVRSADQAAASFGGGPVRQWEHMPGDLMVGSGGGSGVAPKAMLDSARQGLHNKANEP